MPFDVSPRPVRDRKPSSLEKRRARQVFVRTKKAETQYARSLRKVAHHVGMLVSAFSIEDMVASAKLQQLLWQYAQALHPWARAVAKRMLAEVTARDDQAWAKVSNNMGRELRKEIQTAPIGAVLQQRLNDQVHLITSLPIEAGQRVHKLTLEAITTGSRASEVAKEIARSGQVTASRATLIARTEVARTASVLTETRARHVGADSYIWRTAGDSDVRKSHRQMEGKVVQWDEPPTLSDGTVTHAGQIYNCRCYPEPIVPDYID